MRESIVTEHSDTKKVKKVTYSVKFPIGVKLAVIIGFIVLISLGTVTYLNSHFVGEDVKITAENNNLSTNARAASTMEDNLFSLMSDSRYVVISSVPAGISRYSVS